MGQSYVPQTDDTFRLVHNPSSPHNAGSCSECHAVPVLGGSSKVTVIRSGNMVSGRYIGVGSAGVLHKRNEVEPHSDPVFTGLRVALNLLGDGYVEVVADQDLEAIAETQRKQTQGMVHGEVVHVTIPERDTGSKGIGRFGWKSQHASLLSASADALATELGMPNRYFLVNSGASSARRGDQADSELRELNSLVQFLRLSEPVAPDPERSVSHASIVGSSLFDRVGCSVCHIRTLTTAPSGSKIHGGPEIVSARLGGREIHPYSDYLLHDVGSGDGIIQNIRPEDYRSSTANKFRTAPLWGVRYRSWLMHDGKSITYHQAIMRHAGEASQVVRNYVSLTPVEKEHLRAFLDSL